MLAPGIGSIALVIGHQSRQGGGWVAPVVGLTVVCLRRSGVPDIQEVVAFGVGFTDVQADGGTSRE